jgi:hypothetical protein
MTAGRSETEKPRRRVAGLMLVTVIAIAGGAFWLLRTEGGRPGPTVGERLGALRAERAALQAKADGIGRVELLTAFRGASLLFDALAVRGDAERERIFDRLPAARHKAFAELEALNATLRDASERPGPGARFAVAQAAGRIAGELERLAAVDDSPVILAYTPSFVPPRRATGELTLAPGTPRAAPGAGDWRHRRSNGAALCAVVCWPGRGRSGGRNRDRRPPPRVAKHTRARALHRDMAR